MSRVEFDLFDGLGAMIGLLIGLEAPMRLASYDEIYTYPIVCITYILLAFLEGASREKYRAIRVIFAILVLLLRIMARNVSEAKEPYLYFAGNIALVICLTLVAFSVLNRRVFIVTLISTVVYIVQSTFGTLVNYDGREWISKLFSIITGLFVGTCVILLGCVRR